MTMENCKGKTTCRLLLLLLILMLRLPSAYGEEPRKAPEKPSVAKFIQETVSLWKKSHQTSWQKVKNVKHELQMQFSPPNLDFRSREDAEGGDDGLKGKMTEAVGKSFGASKDAVEETANSAAKVVEKAVHKTAYKIKHNPSENQHSHGEL